MPVVSSDSKYVFIMSLMCVVLLAVDIVLYATWENKHFCSKATNPNPNPDLSYRSATIDLSDNECAEWDGAAAGFSNVDCLVGAVKEQAGANVTVGYKGNLPANGNATTIAYYKTQMCPVNVHWHLGTEHLSVGEYDEAGTGPSDIHDRRKLAGKGRQGFQCRLYDDSKEMFTKHYDWKHCTNMEVGQTYEIHWPHSAAGACGTPNQYQEPFYQGVFCRLNLDVPAENPYNLLGDLPGRVGVQAQIFTVVNDESYYYPDLMRGMIVDGAEMGQHITKYTGSTTGDKRSNTVCSVYTPITWQVDRKCHLISASSFDKMCADMKAQSTDLSKDLYPHGSRELVNDTWAADNQEFRYLRN